MALFTFTVAIEVPDGGDNSKTNTKAYQHAKLIQNELWEAMQAVERNHESRTSLSIDIDISPSDVVFVEPFGDEESE